MLPTALAAVPAAPAKDGDVRRAGRCTGASTAKIKLSEENGRIEIEFEVDQNRVGVRWNIVLRRNGTVIRRASRVTRAERSFELRALDEPHRRRADHRDGDAGGERCSAAASF